MRFILELLQETIGTMYPKGCMEMIAESTDGQVGVPPEKTSNPQEWT